ncbi:MAG: DUF819 family protein [candidate division Zixibacteria bacterium]|nr:DUF819 family protein [candidate division Zixibacteria bacterium]MBU1469461.1 DUF819 family protein [candidate division Zixibacteria bacterium]MBU2624215.1 DUF819 family protein [candidate division Zixibacteria bacterium]
MLEKKTGWKIFNFFPPLIFIYMIPAVLSNTGVMTNDSPVYGWMSDLLLPLFLTIMLLDVDVKGAVRVMGRGIFVMLLGTVGVIVGAPIGYFCVKSALDPEAWRGFGTLAGSWIGGTGNMAAVNEALKTIQGVDPSIAEQIAAKNYGLAAIADNMVYLIWLPIMLGSKNLAKRFNKFTGVSQKRLDDMHAAAGELSTDKGKVEMRHILYLLFFGLAVTFVASSLAGVLPTKSPILTASTWKILLVTSLALLLSLTRARKIPGSHPLAMALVYLFVAKMGGSADISGLAEDAPWFVAGAYIWIFIHGVFCLLGAKIFKVDVHTVAIASAANIGGAASAPIVAAYHNEALVPVSILMALIGYAIGNYGALAAAWLCSLVA